VDVHKREGAPPMWTHVEKEEEGQKPDFNMDVINGWPLGYAVSS